MLYTILGLIIGAIITTACCSITRVSDYRPAFGPSNADLMILAGTIFGGGAGFAIGMSKISGGTYPF